MAAIVPPEQQTAVAPVAPAAPPAAAPFVSPVAASSTAELSTLYEDAIQSGNPASMYSLTSRAKGTPYEGAIRKSAETMNRYVADFEENVKKPIERAGGVGTGQGNIAAAKVYETIADQPQKGRAFFEWLIGNKNWSQFITGGKPTTTIGYDSNGKQLERTINELGQVISVRDGTTRQLLTPKEVDERGGFLPSLENALGFQQQKELSQFNAKAFNASTEMAALAATVAPGQRAAAKEGSDIFQKLYDLDLTPDQRKAIGLFSNEQTSKSQNRSAGLTGLSQAINSTDNKVGAEYVEALKPMLAAMGFKLGADRTIQNSSGQSASKSQLESLQKNLSESTESNQQFTRDAATFLKREVFNNLNPEERTLLGRAFDLQFSIEKTNANMGDRRLPFLKNPAAMTAGDEFSRAEASMLAHEFNADAMEAYANWRKKELVNFKEKGVLPQAMELEAAFARSDEYKALAAAYAARNKDLFARPAPKGRQPAAAAPAGNFSDRRAAELGLATPRSTPDQPALLERKFSAPASKPAARAADSGVLPSESETAGAISRLARPALADLIKKSGGR